MPLSLPPYDQNAGKALDVGIRHYLSQHGGPDQDPAMVANTDFASFSESYMVKVYSLGLDWVLAGTDLRTLEPHSWRCVVAGDGRHTISCDVSIDAPDDPSTLLSICHDGCGDRLAWLRFIWGLPGVAAEDYELRYLNIPALSIEVFWLRGLPTAVGGPAKPDQIVGVSLNLDGLPDNALVPMSRFLEIVRPLAEERMACNDRLAH